MDRANNIRVELERRDLNRQRSDTWDDISRCRAKREFCLNWPIDNEATAPLTSVNATAASYLDFMLPFAARGRVVLDAAKKGHEAVYGTKSEKRERWSAYQRELEKVHKEHPNWGITAVRDDVAEKYKVRRKTIERHTEKTW